MRPFHDLLAQYLAHRREIDAAVQGVLESGSYILGEALARFERDFAAYLGCAHAVGVASGTAALELALRALDIGPGDEVAIPALTAVPTAAAVLAAGATPLLVDVDPDLATLDPNALEAALTPRTRAVVPVHLYGQCADMTRILELADARGLAVVEDAAQAHGARFAGRRAGTLGRLGCFSFYPTKNLGAYGDGGAVVTSDPELAERVRALRQYAAGGASRPGANHRMDELQAAMLAAKLPHLEAWNERRRAHAAAYMERLGSSSVRPLALQPGGEHVYHQFVVRCPRRDPLRAHLEEAGIETRIHYPEALHQVADLRGHVRWASPPHRAASLVREIVSLPIYPELPPADLELALQALGAFA